VQQYFWTSYAQMLVLNSKRRTDDIPKYNVTLCSLQGVWNIVSKTVR
jgi:hypothetical protein